MVRLRVDCRENEEEMMLGIIENKKETLIKQYFFRLSYYVILSK